MEVARREWVWPGDESNGVDMRLLRMKKSLLGLRLVPWWLHITTDAI